MILQNIPSGNQTWPEIPVLNGGFYLAIIEQQMVDFWPWPAMCDYRRLVFEWKNMEKNLQNRWNWPSKGSQCTICFHSKPLLELRTSRLKAPLKSLSLRANKFVAATRGVFGKPIPIFEEFAVLKYWYHSIINLLNREKREKLNNWCPPRSYRLVYSRQLMGNPRTQRNIVMEQTKWWILQQTMSDYPRVALSITNKTLYIYMYIYMYH